MERREKKEKSSAEAEQFVRETLFNGKVKQKVLISLNRDTGYCFDLPANTPADKVPDGNHILPFVGTPSQIARKIKQMQKNPSIIERYSVL